MKGPGLRFRAVIYKVGMLRCVDVPGAIVEKLALDPYIPVRGTVDGHEFRGMLLPRGGNARRLYLNTIIRQAAGVDTGATVDLSLALDTESREPPFPLDLAEALEAREGAREAFDLLSPGQRREILQWFAAAKGAATRIKRIRRLLEHLRAGGKRRPK